jgi:hypothetical protein
MEKDLDFLNYSKEQLQCVLRFEKAVEASIARVRDAVELAHIPNKGETVGRKRLSRERSETMK